MSNSEKQILSLLPALTKDELINVANECLAQIDRNVGEIPKHVLREWVKEAKERVASLDRGETTARPWSEVKAELNKKYNLNLNI